MTITEHEFNVSFHDDFLDHPEQPAFTVSQCINMIKECNKGSLLYILPDNLPADDYKFWHNLLVSDYKRLLNVSMRLVNLILNLKESTNAE